MDHVGHKLTILHEKMAEKLTQMDNLVYDVINAINDDTLLIVMGDHGATIEGDHGGSSDDETETVMMLYWKKGFLSRAVDRETEVFLHNPKTPSQIN